MITSKAYFVCGTDTDVGKTTVCAGLLRNMPHAHAIKVIQTGEGLIDQQVYQKADSSVKATTLFHLSFAASPHLAAQRENGTLDYQEVRRQLQREVAAHGLTIVEGSGGIMTPITTDKTFCDLMADLGYPVVLVIKNVLGAINHALLTINMLRQCGIPIQGLIFTTPVPAADDDQQTILDDNIRFIASTTQLPVIAHIPFIPELGKTPESWKVLAQYLTHASALLTDLEQPDTDNTLAEFDQEHVWHPYAQAISESVHPVIVKAKGVKLILDTGDTITDGTSSWWTAIHGYSHPELVRTVQQQSTQLSHVMFGGLTHQPAIRLAQKLLSLVPVGLQHVFYVDSGSVAIEVALKMARQYWSGMGKSDKTQLISFCGGYHGDTTGAMSISDPNSIFSGRLNTSLFNTFFAPRPEIPFGAEFNDQTLDSLRQFITQHHHQAAAIVIEPIVQCAGGMWFYHPYYLKALRHLCDEFHLLLIVDEIAVGFGRTGKLFASEWANITPDIMCIGKALTGGMLTLAATLTTGRVAEGIAASGKALMHGPTYMGNPLACQVALTSLDLLEKNHWQQQVQHIAQQLEFGLSPCKTCKVVKDIRVLGAIGVVELSQPVNVKRLQHYFIQHHVWIRPFDHIIYVMPPYVSTDDDIRQLCHAICQAVEEGIWA